MTLTPITPNAATGYVTLPAEAGQEGNVIDLVRRWGADAIRDSLQRANIIIEDTEDGARWRVVS